MLILLIVLVLLCFGGGWYAGPGLGYNGGFSIGTILLIILIILLFRGGLR